MVWGSMSSFQLVLVSFGHTQLLFESFFAFEHDSMFQAHLVPSLIQSWKQAVLQEILILYSVTWVPGVIIVMGDIVARPFQWAKIDNLQLIKPFIHLTFSLWFQHSFIVNFLFYNWILGFLRPSLI